MNKLHVEKSFGRMDIAAGQIVIGAKRRAVITGLFFILATVSAILGAKLYDPILATPEYLVDGARHSSQIVGGAVFELILAIANIGTGIMLSSYLKRYSESMGLAYLVFRLLEVVFILIGVVSVLSLLSLSQLFADASAPDRNAFYLIGSSLKAIHYWTFILGPHFMLGVNTFVYSFVFYKSGLVPKRLATIGVSGAVMVFIAALLLMFNVVKMLSGAHILLTLPIASYEMILASWLIVKGFNEYPAMKKSTNTLDVHRAVFLNPS
jgi:hypothetical protein